MIGLSQGFRQSLRRILKTPGFTLVVALTLALGIGANAAILSVVNGVLLRPLPYEDPDGLVTIYHHYPSLDDLHAPRPGRCHGQGGARHLGRSTSDASTTAPRLRHLACLP